jgi:hypothetical protein
VATLATDNSVRFKARSTNFQADTLEVQSNFGSIQFYNITANTRY